MQHRHRQPDSLGRQTDYDSLTSTTRSISSDQIPGKEYGNASIYDTGTVFGFVVSCQVQSNNKQQNAVFLGQDTGEVGPS